MGQGSGASGAAGPPGADLPELLELLLDSVAPNEIVAALGGAADPVGYLEQLLGTGSLPSFDEVLGDLMAGWTDLLDEDCSPLDAELAGIAFLGVLRDHVSEEAEQLELLGQLIEQAEELASPEALAMLRVLSTIGPEPLQHTSAASADRLVARGLTDCGWATDLGRPKVSRSFGYSDIFGSQEAIAMTFSYGRLRHALVVLIDHDLGGGIKDVWVSDRPNWIRAQYTKAAGADAVEFQDYSSAEAAAIMTQALSKGACPVEHDQVDDVRDYLDLVVQRVALLTASASGTAKSGAVARRKKPAPTGGRSVHRLKVTLRGIRPPIWRRLEVPSDVDLDRLHLTIQVAFGWENCHLWGFATPKGAYGGEDDFGRQSAHSATLAKVIPRKGQRITYTYDFGDTWEHEVLVEEVAAADPTAEYPRCLAGSRACPPEDCGGPWGYGELLQILADPDHEEHTDRLDWLGLESATEFDPAAFDVADTNGALAHVRVPAPPTTPLA